MIPTISNFLSVDWTQELASTLQNKAKGMRFLFCIMPQKDAGSHHACPCLLSCVCSDENQLPCFQLPHGEAMWQGMGGRLWMTAREESRPSIWQLKELNPVNSYRSGPGSESSLGWGLSWLQSWDWGIWKSCENTEKAKACFLSL